MGAAVEVIPDYLSRVVDALRTGSGTAWGIDGRVGAAAVEEAAVGAVDVIPDYLSGGVDGLRNGLGAAWGIDGRVGAAAVEEADQAYSAKKTKKGVSSDTIVHAANVACGRSERRVNACQTFGISRQCDLKGWNILRRHQPGIVAQCPKFATEMMRANAGFHPDQARRHIG